MFSTWTDAMLRSTLPSWTVNFTLLMTAAVHPLWTTHVMPNSPMMSLEPLKVSIVYL